MDTTPDLLNEKQEMFCQEYLVSLNGTQAYLTVYKDATYNTARTQASKLLAEPNIYARIKELIEARKDRVQVSQDFVIRGLIEVANKCQQATPVMVFDPIEKCMVQAQSAEGEPIYEFDSSGANRALELLGKHLGTFEKDNNQKKPVVNVGFKATDDEDEA